MENFKILTEVSPWYILGCVVAALGYAFLLYKKKPSWSQKLNRLLFAFRFITTFILFFLLTGPLLKMVKNYFEKPAIVFAIDNSASVKLATDTVSINDFKNGLTELEGKLKNEDYDIDIQILNQETKPESLKNIQFNNKTTNLSGMIGSIRNNYENRNLAGIVLASDGIYNQGTDPTYEEYNFPVYTLALGDPVEKKDLFLKNLRYNKISFAGNRFPILAEIGNHGFSGNIEVVLKKGEEVLEKRNVTVGGKSLIETEFMISGEKTGIQHFEISITPAEGEFTRKNNNAHAYVEIINDKEKVLIVALTPHPDIKALRSAIEQKENFQVEVFIPGINKLPEDKYDLVILHQLPDIFNQYASLGKVVRDASSTFYITGNQTNIDQLNGTNPIVDILSRGNQKDNATPSFNQAFEKFAIEKEDQAIINDYPPLVVPFGNYQLKGETNVILWQKIGNIQTDNPLLVTGMHDGKKVAVLTGEGIWQWRINEAKTTSETKVFDKLFSNVVQFLSAKEDKRKFRLYSTASEYNESEAVKISAELYNDVYEKIYEKKINIILKDELGKSKQYSFLNSEGNSSIEIKGLKPGLYNFTGSVNLDNKTYTASGAFVIKEMVLEATNITADHNMLKDLASKSKGGFYTPGELERLFQDLVKHEKPSVIHTNEEYQEFINLPWIFFLIIILLTAEWGIRKYNGGY